MSNQVELTVIVPAYNEGKRITKTLLEIKKFFDIKKISYEILVVNDGSKDNTVDAVTSLNLSNVTILDYGTNKGKGYAVNFGVMHARGKWILFTDADNSTPIEEYLKLSELQDSCDVIIGSRYLRNSNIVVKQSRLRVILSRIGNILAQLVLLRGIRDTQCGFKLFSVDAAKRIFDKQTIWRWGFDMEILRISRELGYQIKEVPITWYNDEQTHIQSRRVFLTTLLELLTIKINSLKGLYTENGISEGAVFIKFALVGISGTLLDFIVLNVANRVFGLSLLLSLTLGFSIGAINNYIFNSKWSYRQRLSWSQLYQFMIIAIGGLAINNVLVYELSSSFNWKYNYAKVIAVIIVFFWNYTLNRVWTFSQGNRALS